MQPYFHEHGPWSAAFIRDGVFNAAAYHAVLKQGIVAPTSVRSVWNWSAGDLVAMLFVGAVLGLFIGLMLENTGLGAVVCLIAVAVQAVVFTVMAANDRLARKTAQAEYARLVQEGVIVDGEVTSRNVNLILGSEYNNIEETRVTVLTYMLEVSVTFTSPHGLRHTHKLTKALSWKRLSDDEVNHIDWDEEQAAAARYPRPPVGAPAFVLYYNAQLYRVL